jgi:predicted PurR-regulated permease PerM
MSNNPELKPTLPIEEEIKYSPTIKRIIVITILLLIGYLVFRTGEVLPPFIWAVVTAFIFNGPIKTLTTRFGTARWVWTTLIYLVFFAIIGIGLLLIIPAISKEAKTLSTDAPKMQQTVNEYLRDNPTISIAGIDVPSENVKNAVDNVLEKLPGLAQDLGPKLLSGTFRFIIDFLLYLVATFYLLLMGGRSIGRFINSVPLKYRSEMRLLFARINRVLTAYLKGQLILVAIMSTSSFILFTILGVRYALTLAIMVGILELVPFVGPYLAIAICCGVAFFQEHGPKISFGMDGITLAIVVGVALFALRQIEDYLIIPNVIGRIVELPALLVIFTIVVAAALLGPLGLLLGVPLVAVLKIIFGYIYYKLVDAEREKVILPTDITNEELYNTVEGYSPGSRLLLIPTDKGLYLRDHDLLKRLKELGDNKKIDLAFYCSEDEETSHAVREFEFPVITMEQEHFLVTAKH